MKTKLFHLIIHLLISISPLIECRSQSVIPHPVPEEFTSTMNVVSVNGLPVQIFHAGLNVCFPSFDFTGSVDNIVTAGRIQGEKSTNRKYAGQLLSEYSQH